MHIRHESEVNRLLAAVRNQEPEAEARLMELTYRELRKIASACLRRERVAASVQPSDLVHEAYLRLAGQEGKAVLDRAQFLQFAAHAMRQILVDRARKRNAVKRGGGALRISLDGALEIANERSGDILILHSALERLQNVDVRQCQVVEMKFFAGMSISDIANVLNVTERTVNRDWRMARAWLYQEVYG